MITMDLYIEVFRYIEVVFLPVPVNFTASVGFFRVRPNPSVFGFFLKTLEEGSVNNQELKHSFI